MLSCYVGIWLGEKILKRVRNSPTVDRIFVHHLGKFVKGPYKRTQTAALRCLPRRRGSRRGAKVDEGEKESLVYCGSSTAAAIYIYSCYGRSR